MEYFIVYNLNDTFFLFKYLGKMWTFFVVNRGYRIYVAFGMEERKQGPMGMEKKEK